MKGLLLPQLTAIPKHTCLNKRCSLTSPTTWISSKPATDGGKTSIGSSASSFCRNGGKCSPHASMPQPANGSGRVTPNGMSLRFRASVPSRVKRQRWPTPSLDVPPSVHRLPRRRIHRNLPYHRGDTAEPTPNGAGRLCMARRFGLDDGVHPRRRPFRPVFQPTRMGRGKIGKRIGRNIPTGSPRSSSRREPGSRRLKRQSLGVPAGPAPKTMREAATTGELGFPHQLALESL